MMPAALIPLALKETFTSAKVRRLRDSQRKFVI